MNLSPAASRHLHAVTSAATRKHACPVLFAILGAAALSPLLWVEVPPLVDYPNHLARMWILAHGAEISDLARNYAIHWRLLPNLGMDLVVPVLSRVMPIEEAGRVFIALTMLTL